MMDFAWLRAAGALIASGLNPDEQATLETTLFYLEVALIALLAGLIVFGLALRTIAKRSTQPCPSCMEFISKRAQVCPRCGQRVQPAPGR